VLGGVVEFDGVEQVFGDGLGAVQDRFDRGAAEEVRQAADDAAGALVQVAVERGEGAGPVVA
jgi:hypothetical protein